MSAEKITPERLRNMAQFNRNRSIGSPGSNTMLEEAAHRIEELEKNIEDGHGRLLQIVLKALEFFDRHGGPAKVAPSCMGCGVVRERSTEHMELPNVYLCKTCVTAIQVMKK